MCAASIRKEVIDSLKETGNTDTGLYALFQAVNIYPNADGEEAALALRKTDPKLVTDFALRMLKGRRVDTEEIGCSIASVAMYFDGSMKALGGILKNEPKSLPEFLASLRESEMKFLSVPANGSDLLAWKMKKLLKVMNAY